VMCDEIVVRLGRVPLRKDALLSAGVTSLITTVDDGVTKWGRLPQLFFGTLGSQECCA
jgi:exoribonuclease II